MEIIYKSIDEVIPYKNNPRNNEDAVEFVANSIKEFGFKNPIILDKDDVIVAGHTRLEASKRLGLENVPCIYANDLTDEQIKAFRLADNKTAEFAKWDFGMLSEELEDLAFDMSEFGFEVSDFESMNIDGMFEDSLIDKNDKEEDKTIICPNCGEIIEI